MFRAMLTGKFCSTMSNNTGPGVSVPGSIFSPADSKLTRATDRCNFSAHRASDEQTAGEYRTAPPIGWQADAMARLCQPVSPHAAAHDYPGIRDSPGSNSLDAESTATATVW